MKKIVIVALISVALLTSGMSFAQRCQTCAAYLAAQQQSVQEAQAVLAAQQKPALEAQAALAAVEQALADAINEDSSNGDEQMYKCGCSKPKPRPTSRAQSTALESTALGLPAITVSSNEQLNYLLQIIVGRLNEIMAALNVLAQK